ncbi:MAG: AlpA family phage regulatory protein [Planctomycetia bacterium]|nr:AlpA family phage regulatory protein [Planctomycetia bacterium]
MELFDVKAVALLTSLSVRQIWKLTASDRFPKPVRISRSVRWRRCDIESWIKAGCLLPEGVSAR